MLRMFRQAMIIVLLLSGMHQAHAGTYTKTQYPVVLVHGLFGFDELLWLDYFYKIPQTLQNNGSQVFVASVSPANATEVRGEQLIDYIQAVRDYTGAEKVNLIGHSHGGPTVRYAASVVPEWVASATSVAGVNWGSAVADDFRASLQPGSITEGVTATVANAFADIVELLSGTNPSQLPTDSVAALEALTTAETLMFNQRYPEGMPSTYCGYDGDLVAPNGVYYFSWSGGSTYTNVFDLADPLLAITGLTFGEANDGLVSSCSSHLGYVLKDNYRMNHLDIVNQTFGIHHLFETDPVQVFKSHVNLLKRLGL